MLLLMRHAEAELGLNDRHRALTLRGQQYAAEQAARLPAAPQRILTSPYLRALQTAQQVLKHWPASTLIEDERLSPEGNVDEALAALAQHWQTPLLVVSHLPLIGLLSQALLDGRDDNPTPFLPGQWQWLELDWPARSMATERVGQR